MYPIYSMTVLPWNTVEMIVKVGYVVEIGKGVEIVGKIVDPSWESWRTKGWSS